MSASGTPALDVNTLPGMSLDQLRVLWKQHMGRRRPPAQRSLIIRELAWTIQERAYGGLDPETKRLLEAAIRDAVASLRSRRGYAKRVTPSGRNSPGQGPYRRRITGSLPAASRLVRTWHGRTYEVQVLDGGTSFRYRDRTYASLTEIAREITGTSWSGPRFFGLVTRARNGGAS